MPHAGPVPPFSQWRFGFSLRRTGASRAGAAALPAFRRQGHAERAVFAISSDTRCREAAPEARGAATQPPRVPAPSWKRRHLPIRTRPAAAPCDPVSMAQEEDPEDPVPAENSLRV